MGKGDGGLSVLLKNWFEFDYITVEVLSKHPRNSLKHFCLISSKDRNCKAHLKI